MPAHEVPVRLARAVSEKISPALIMVVRIERKTNMGRQSLDVMFCQVCHHASWQKLTCDWVKVGQLVGFYQSVKIVSMTLAIYPPEFDARTCPVKSRHSAGMRIVQHATMSTAIVLAGLS